MDIKMEITFSDGSSINVTELQYKELKNIKTYKIKKSGIDYFKNRILKILSSNGKELTSGRLVNILRCYDRIDDYDMALDSLVDDGMVKIREKKNKHGKEITKIITVI